jgi:hypothetical protein
MTPSPISGRAVRPSAALLVENSGDQACGGLGRIAPEPLDKLDIPVMVQVVGGKPVYGHLLSIAAGVVIVGSVKWLMHVADEMQQEL